MNSVNTRGTKQRLPPKNIVNTFQAVQSIFRYLGMQPKEHYKIRICPVILGELEPSKLQGLQYDLPENFSYESDNSSLFLSSSLYEK